MILGGFWAESVGDLWAEFLLPWSCARVYCLFLAQGLSSIIVPDIGVDFAREIEEGDFSSLGFEGVSLWEN